MEEVLEKAVDGLVVDVAANHHKLTLTVRLKARIVVTIDILSLINISHVM